MAFLRDDDYDDLPEDDGEAFAKLEGIARSRLHETLMPDEKYFEYEECLRYMNDVSALGHELNVPDLSFDHEADNMTVEYARFTRSVDFRLTQIRLQRARRIRRNTIAITGPTREKIQHHLERLKEEVTNSNIPEKRKQSLLGRIADFEAELTKRRVNLAAVMTVIALVSSVVHDNAETLVEGPKIVQSISALFGAAREDEDEAARLLPPPQPFKAIPDLRPNQPQTRKSIAAPDKHDDDVPF